MALLVAVTYSLVVGLLAGGSLRRLARVRLWGETGLLLALVVPLLVPLVTHVESMGSVGLLSLWLSASLVGVTVAALNHPKPGMLVAACGFLLNAAVVVLNSGMPVLLPYDNFLVRGMTLPAGTRPTIHVAADPGTKLLVLGDVLPAVLPAQLRYMVSLGDLLLLVGICALIVWGMTGTSDKGEDTDADADAQVSSLVKRGRHSARRRAPGIAEKGR